MSVREEDKNKNCPSRGLGIAAAAIGVGVGAALYYYFSKRPENPADGGATTSGWAREDHALHDPDSSYTTISEHSTTDTSVHDSSSSSEDFMQAISRRLWNVSESDIEYSNTSHDLSQDFMDSLGGISSDSETNTEWDVTASSLDVPRYEPRAMYPIMMQFGEQTIRMLNPQSSSWKSPWKLFRKYYRSDGEQMNQMQDQAFRERPWTLEECSICFEGMQRDHEVLALECTHRFHQACIMPWLQEQQTCPNCRKAS